VKRAPLFLVGLTALAACASTGKREAASLVAAVERFESVDPSAKTGAADVLRGAPSSDPEVSDAKASCLDGVDHTLRALALKAEVEAKLAELEHDAAPASDPAMQALPAKLDQSEALLKEGRSKMKECDSKVTALRMKYDL
jgi:hypothetical protein